MSLAKPASIYDPAFVSRMFDRMSKTYGLANYVTSFGFTERWRKQCVADLPEAIPDAIGYDLMSGMGENWEILLRKLKGNPTLYAVDISDEMNRKAAAHLQRIGKPDIRLQKADVLENEIPSSSADFVVSTFGLKTFNSAQQERLAHEIARILKPNGVFSLIEISEPSYWWLKPFFMFYLKWAIPLIGWAFLNNAADYKMLGKYCAGFGNCQHFSHYLKAEGLEVTYKEYFFGCASGVFGRKAR